MKKKYVAVVMAMVGMGLHSYADIVSVNLGSPPSTPVSGTELVGAPGSQDAADNWIDAAIASDDNSASTGSVTEGGITVSFSANYSNGFSSTGGNEDDENSKMMSTLMAMNNEGGTFVTISGLGSAFTTSGYKLIVYCQSDTSRTHGLTATDNAATTPNTASGVSGTTVMGYYEANGYDANNVVVLTGFTGDTVTLTRDASNGGVPQITGVQLQTIPEPATIGLVALFGGSIFFIRRKLSL